MDKSVIKKEDGSLLIEAEDGSVPPKKFLVVIPAEVEAAETRHVDDTRVASTLGSPSGSHVNLRHCGGVEWFTTKGGRPAVKIIPGSTHLLMYGRVQYPVDRVAWSRCSKTLKEIFDADLYVENRRGNSFFGLRVAEKQLVRLCAEELIRSKGR